MRGHIAHILATVLMVVSLGAAQRPTSSESVKTGSKTDNTRAGQNKPDKAVSNWDGFVVRKLLSGPSHGQRRTLRHVRPDRSASYTTPG